MIAARHRNIPVFIPQMGCPHACVFCDQAAITDGSRFNEGEVAPQIERALATVPAGEPPEIAYFGGSFTGIDRGLMLRLLDLAAGYVRSGRASGIRFSTRPDLIDEELLSVLKGYPISAIELGLQSMDDRVLSASGRGYPAERARSACRAVRKAGFPLVGQMMVGLPESSPVSEIAAAREICDLGAAACRIYPTVVFRNTALEQMMKRGDYRPLTVEEAVARSADVLEVFRSRGVSCLRIGLHASEQLSAAVAGPNHPALGELTLGELYYRKLFAMARGQSLSGRMALRVPRGEASRAVGQRRRNLSRLLRETGVEVTRVWETDCAEPELIPENDRHHERRKEQPCI